MTDIQMLEMRAVTKRFPGVLANDSIDFDVRSGEIHTLLGENGAGKSTLMKILYGMHQPDEGSISMRGEPVVIKDPADAIRLGIGMVHQHFMLVPTLTVTENVALGLPSSRRPLTDLDRVSKRLASLSERYGLRVNPSMEVWKLSVGERQRVEILKALYREARLLVLDEPTAVLTPREVEDLFTTLRHMTAEGKGVVFISHKLREVLAVSSRITVLRQGRVVGETEPNSTSREALARMMVGRDVKMTPDKSPAHPKEVALRVTGLRARNDWGEVALGGISLEVCSGEIVGIAGVSGNGQRELAEVIAGLRPADSGSVELMGVDTTNRGSRPARTQGLSYVPEERMRDGSIGDFTVAENLMLVDHRDPRFSTRGLLRLRAIRRHCQHLIDQFAVKTPSLDAHGRTLSGGNIQKMILARELSAEPTVLVAAQPTRGIDVGSAEYIHRCLIDRRDRGAALLVISEDLDELLGLTDRILVMYEGRSAGIVDTATADRTDIGMRMAGVGTD